MSTNSKILSVILGLLLIASIVATVYITSSSPSGERFTESYLLGTDGKAAGYPRELVLGEKGRVILGIVNHEYQDMSYSVMVRLGGTSIARLGPVSLQHGQKWEQEVTFSPTRAGENQQVEFLVFKGGESQPYRSLHLWLNVREKG